MGGNPAYDYPVAAKEFGAGLLDLFPKGTGQAGFCPQYVENKFKSVWDTWLLWCWLQLARTMLGIKSAQVGATQ